jgi:polar amino acid transport system substrate-binding protein
VAILSAAALLVMLGGLGGNAPRSSPHYVSKGVLTVGTNLPAPGFWNGDDPSSISGGLEYDLAKGIAKKLKLKGVKVVNVSFDALVAGKARGFDLALSQVTITKERAKVVDFSTPYFNSDLGILVKKGTKVKDAAAAKKLKFGVQTSTTSQDYLSTTLKPDSDPQVYQETSQAFAALQAGQVDAVLLDTAIVVQQAAQSNGQFEVVAQFKSGDQYGAVFAKGSKVKKKVDKIIKSLKSDGTVAKLAADNLGGDPSKIPFIKV